MAQARIGFDFNASCKDAEAPVKSLVNFLMKNGCLNFGMDFRTSSEASCEIQLDAERSEGNKYVFIVSGIYDTGEEGMMSETVIANGRLYSEDSEDEYVIKNQVFRLEKEEPEEPNDPEEEPEEPTYRMTITADKEEYTQFDELMLLQIPKVKNTYSWFSANNTYWQNIGHSVMIPFISQDALREITHPLYAVSYNHPKIKDVVIVSKRNDYNNLKLVFSLDSGNLYIDVKDGDTLIASGETNNIILDGDICTVNANNLLYLMLSGDGVNYQLFRFIDILNTAVTVEDDESGIEFDFSDTDEIEVSLQGGAESAASILEDDYASYSKYKFNSAMEPVTSSLQSFHTIPNMYMNEEEPDPYLRNCAFAIPTNDVNIPVNITVETSITDDEKDYLPYSVAIKSDSSYIDGWSTNYGKIKITIADESKHSVDYQLRTSSFTVINAYNTNYESDDYIFHVDTQDVYYKIGIFPLDGKESSVADIKTQLMNCTFTNELMIGSKEERNTVLALRNNYEENIVPTFDEIIRDTDICSLYPFYEDGRWAPNQIRFPNSALLPLYTTNKSQHTNTLTAFIYLQMCKNDGTPVDKSYYVQNEESDGYTAYIQINNEPTETSSETYEDGDELPPEPAELDSLTAKISIIENDEEHTGFIASEIDDGTTNCAVLSFKISIPQSDLPNLEVPFRYVCDNPDATLVNLIENNNVPATVIAINGSDPAGVYIGDTLACAFNTTDTLPSSITLVGLTFNLYGYDSENDNWTNLLVDLKVPSDALDTSSATWTMERNSPSVSATDLITGVFTVQDTDKFTYHGYTKFFWRVNSSDQDIRNTILNLATFTFTYNSNGNASLTMIRNDGESESWEIATFNGALTDFTDDGVDFELYAYHVNGGSTYPTIPEGTLYNRITDSVSLMAQSITLSNVSPLETDLSKFYVTDDGILVPVNP